MRDKILVVGGYGQVGKEISTILVNKGKTVIAAGRSINKAKEFATKSPKIIPMQIDIYNMDENNPVFKEIELVIMCLDQSNTDFVKLCIYNNINYIDISPSYTILSKIEKLNEIAKAQGVMLLLGVGVAPGLSNILAYELEKSFDNIMRIDSYLMLGIGEKHGFDGIKWLVNNITKKYYIIDNGLKKEVKCFTSPKKISLIGESKKRTFYHFDLADWHIMTQTLSTDNIVSRFAYDINWLTKGMAFMKKLGLLYFAKFKSISVIYEKIFALSMNLLQKLKIGTERYAVQIEITGQKYGKTCVDKIIVTGENNSFLTATIAAIAAEQVSLKETTSGVVYLEQFLSIRDLEKDLKKCPKFRYIH